MLSLRDLIRCAAVSAGSDMQPRFTTVPTITATERDAAAIDVGVFLESAQTG